MPELRAETVTTTAGLEALAPEWAALWQRAPAATPFQSPAWLIPWWRHFGNDALHALAVREGDRLVGLLPLYLLREPGCAKLLPLGIAISDHLDGLFAPGREQVAAAAMLRHLRSMPGAWDVCELRPLRAGSPLLDAPDPLDRRAEILPLEPCPALAIGPGARDLSEILPASIRGNLRRYGRRAARRGTVRFETASAASVGELLEALIALHEARWAARAGAGVLADSRVKEFHREAAPTLHAGALLRLHALRIDGHVVAVGYALFARRCLHYYLTGFDPAYAAISPSTLLLGYAVERALREGAHTVDFLRGGERYKYLWGAEDRPSFARRLRPAEPSMARRAAG